LDVEQLDLGVREGELHREPVGPVDLCDHNRTGRGALDHERFAIRGDGRRSRLCRSFGHRDQSKMRKGTAIKNQPIMPRQGCTCTGREQQDW
jgi:hypothetical protein